MCFYTFEGSFLDVYVWFISLLYVTKRSDNKKRNYNINIRKRVLLEIYQNYANFFPLVFEKSWLARPKEQVKLEWPDKLVFKQISKD